MSVFGIEKEREGFRLLLGLRLNRLLRTERILGELKQVEASWARTALTQ